MPGIRQGIAVILGIFVVVRELKIEFPLRHQRYNQVGLAILFAHSADERGYAKGATH